MQNINKRYAMKKLVSLMLLITSLFAVGFLAGCKDKYSDMKITLYQVLEETEQKIETDKGLEIELKSANEPATVVIKSVIDGVKKNISRQSVFSTDNSGVISVTPTLIGDEYSTVTITANKIGNTSLEVRSKEGGKTIVLPIKVLIKVTNVIANKNYIPAVVMGDSAGLVLNYSKILDFKPGGTNQRDVRYALVNPVDGVNLNGNLLTVLSNYNLTKDTHKIKIIAWSVAGSNAGLNHTEVSENLKCEFDVFVVENISATGAKIQFYDYDNQQIVDESNNLANKSINLICNSDAQYDSVYVKLSVGSVYDIMKSGDKIGLKIDYILKDGTQNRFVEIKQDATDPSLFLIKGKTKGIAKIEFVISFSNLKFSTAQPMTSTVLNLNVKEMPVNLMLNGEVNEIHQYNIYTSYVGTNYSGTNVKIEANPTGLDTADKNIYLKFTDSKYVSFFVFKVNGIVLNYDSEKGYNITSGNNVYITLKETSQIPDGNVVLTASILKTPLEFAGKAITPQYYATSIKLNVKEGIDNAEFYLKSAGEYVQAVNNLYIKNDLQNTTKVYVKFDNNNIDLSNVTVKTSNIANLALVDNGNKSVIMLESASKVTHNGTNYYGFDVIGLKEGSFVLTISAPNGYLEEISGKVVKVGGNLSFNPDSENNADIFYKNENINKKLIQLAIRNGTSVPVAINTTTTINKISAKAITADYEGLDNIGDSLSETAVKFSSMLASNLIFFSTHSVGTTVFEISVERFVIQNEIVKISTEKYYFEIASFAPVANFSISKDAMSLYTGETVGVLYKDKSTGILSVSYSSNATKTVKFSNGPVNAYKVKAKFLGLKDDTITGVDAGGVLLAKDITVTKNKATNGTINVYVEQFGKQTTLSASCSVFGLEAVSIEKVIVNVGAVAGNLTLNIKQNASKSFEAYASNADLATFPELTYQIYEIINNRPVLASNNITDIISVRQINNNFAVTGLLGGEVLLRICAKDAFISNNIVKAGYYQEIYITVSDGNESNPYFITNLSELANIEMNKHYVLASDNLDVSSLALPLHNGSNYVFTGGLDGAMKVKVRTNEDEIQTITLYYSLKNLKIKNFYTITESYDTYAYAGLFATNKGTIKNLKLTNVDMQLNADSAYKQVFAGVVAAVNSTGIIDNVVVQMASKTIAHVEISAGSAGEYYLGIICGQNLSGAQILHSQVTDSFAVNVVSDLNSNIYVGALAGENKGVIAGDYFAGQEDDIDNLGTSNAMADIQLTGAGENYFVGGAAGKNTGELKNLKISTSLNGKISGYNAGGVAGLNAGGTIADCLAFGVKVEAQNYAGGIVAAAENENMPESANILNVNVQFIDLYNESKEDDTYSKVAYVTGKYVGGIAGFVKNSFVQYGAVESFLNKQIMLFANSADAFVAGVCAVSENAVFESCFANVNMSTGAYEEDEQTVGYENVEIAGLIAKAADSSVNNAYFIGKGAAAGSQFFGNDITNASLGFAYAVQKDMSANNGYIYGRNSEGLWQEYNLNASDINYYDFRETGFNITDSLSVGDSNEYDWLYSAADNEKLPVLLRRDKTGTTNQSVIYTKIPDEMTVEINADYFADYEKGIHYADAEKERAILFFNESLDPSSPVADILNTHYLFNTSEHNGIFNLIMSTGKPDLGVIFTSGQEFITYNTRERTITIKNVGGASGKIELIVYSLYNITCRQNLTIYITYGVKDFAVYSSANKSGASKIIDGRTLTYLIDSTSMLSSGAENGDYKVNPMLLAEYRAGNDYIVGLNETNVSLFNFNGNEFVYDNDIKSYILRTNANLESYNLIVGTFDYNYLGQNVNSISVSLTAKLYLNFADISGGELSGVEYFNDKFDVNYNINVVKQASEININAHNGETQSSGVLSDIEVSLKTSLIDADFVETVALQETLTSKQPIGNLTTDQIRVAITSGDVQDLLHQAKVSEVSDLFDIYATVTANSGKLIYAFTIQLKNEFNTRYVTRQYVFNFRFYALSNNNKFVDYVLTINPQQITKLDIKHFAEGEIVVTNDAIVTYRSEEIESSIIIPGKSGLVKINLDPLYADVDYLTITSSKLSDGTIISLEQMLFNTTQANNYLYTSLFPRAEVITDGLELRKISEINNGISSYNGFLYVRTLIPSLVAVSEQFIITVKGHKNGVEIIENNLYLQTQYKPSINLNVINGIKVKIENKDTYLLERGSSNEVLAVEIYGYENQNLQISHGYEKVRFVKRSTVEKTVRGSYIHYFDIICYETAEIGNFTALVELHYDDNPQTGSAASESINFAVTDQILKSVRLNGVNNENAISVAIGASVELKLDWTTASGNTKSQSVNELLRLSGENVDDYLLNLYYTQRYNSAGQIERQSLVTYKQGNSVGKNLFETSFSEILQNYKITAKAFTAGTTIYFQVYYSYVLDENGKIVIEFNPNEGDYEIKTSFTLSIYTSTSEDNPLPIYSAEGLKSMVAGQNYILMDDLVLSDWEPLSEFAGEEEGQTGSIASLDGNNKIITILNFAPKTMDSSNNTLTNANVGLFASVGDNTILKNITIDISKLSLINLSSFTTYNYGTLVAENAGIVYNCEIIALAGSSLNPQITILSNDDPNISPSSTVAGALVGVNSGNIINSRVGSPYFTKVHLRQTDNQVLNNEIKDCVHFTFTAKGIVGGLVGINSGIISSSYFANASVENNILNYASSMTAGFVAKNSSGGRITYSYTKGMEDTVSISSLRATGASVQSIGNVAGFVYENAGIINDCYSNIFVQSDSSIVSGFVFESKQNSIIQRCFTTASINSHTALEVPFAGVNEQGETLAETDNIKDCYYLKTEEDNFAVNQTIAKALNISQFQYADAFNGFTFIKADEINGYEKSNIKNAQPNSAIWSYSKVDVKNKKARSVGLMPELTQANQIAVSVRYLASQNEGETGIDYTYRYADGYDFGSEINPYIIRSASEYNSVFADGLLEDSSQLYYVSYKNARFVDDIDFAEVGNDVKTSQRVVLEKSYIDGNGMTISNVSVGLTAGVNVSSIGLFNKIDQSVVKNLTINISKVDGTYVTYAGGLAGVIDNSQIMNINLFGAADTVILARNFAGGLAGLVSGEKTYINNINSNLSAKAGTRSSNLVYNETIPFANEYLSAKQFEILKAGTNLFQTSNGYFQTDIANYGSYVGTLSYAGGLAGVIDIDLQSAKYYYSGGIENEADLVYAPYVNIKEININTGKNSQSESGNNVKIIADNAGGIAGYLGKGAYLSRANFLLNSNATAANEIQYITGYYSAGGIAGQNYGHITLSMVAHDIDTQYAKDSNLFALVNQNIMPDMGNNLVINSEMYAGGFIGVNFGGAVEHCLTKASLYGSNARFTGGFIGANIGGALNTVYTTSMLDVKENQVVGGLIGVNYNYAVDKDGKVKEPIKYDLDAGGEDTVANYLTRVHDYKLFVKNSTKLSAAPSVMLNKVALANSYVKSDFVTLNEQGSEVPAFAENASFGLFIGKNLISGENFVGSPDNTTGTSGTTNILPTYTYYSELYFNCSQKDQLVGNASVKINNNLTTRNLIKYDISTLLNANAIEQPETFSNIFGTWLLQYWSLNSRFFFPTLIKQGYDNYIEIRTEDDFQQIFDKPDANYIIVQDIEMTKIYDSYVINQLFTGTIVGEHRITSQAVVVSGIKIIQGNQNTNSVGFFRQTQSAKISNIIFKIEYIIVPEQNSITNISGFNKKTMNDNIYTGGIIGLDSGSVISDVKVLADFKYGSSPLTGVGSKSYNWGYISSTGQYVGGIVGLGTNTTIVTSEVNVGIKAESDINNSGSEGDSKSVFVGGLVGKLESNEHAGTNIIGENSALIMASTYSTPGQYTSYDIYATATENNTYLYVGGMAGYVDKGTISSADNKDEAVIIFKANNINAYAGGIVGKAQNAYITSVSLKNKIYNQTGRAETDTKATYMGGIAGAATGYSIINDCNMKSESIIGYIQSDINNSWEKDVNESVPTRESTIYAGGIVGQMEGSNDDLTGKRSRIINCFSHAQITNAIYKYTMIGTGVGRERKFEKSNIFITADCYVGGFAGVGRNISVMNSFAAGSINFEGISNTSDLPAKKAYVGGAIGYAMADAAGEKIEIGSVYNYIDMHGSSEEIAAAYSVLTDVNIIIGKFKTIKIGGIIGSFERENSTPNVSVINQICDAASLSRIYVDSVGSAENKDGELYMGGLVGYLKDTLYLRDSYTVSMLDTSAVNPFAFNNERANRLNVNAVLGQTVEGINTNIRNVMYSSDYTLCDDTVGKNLTAQSMLAIESFNKMTAADGVGFNILGDLDSSSSIWTSGFNASTGTLPYPSVFKSKLSSLGYFGGGSALLPLKVENNKTVINENKFTYYIITASSEDVDTINVKFRNVDNESYNSNFYGLLMGNGNKITYDYTLAQNNCYGLFATIKKYSAVSNLIVENKYTGTHSISNSGISFYGGIAGKNYGTIYTCGINSANMSVNSGNFAYLGGIAGLNMGKISNCYSSAEILTQGTYIKAGGVAGINGNLASSSEEPLDNTKDTFALVEYTYFTGAIKMTDGLAGGIAYSSLSDNALIKNCYNAGNFIDASSAQTAVKGGFVADKILLKNAENNYDDFYASYNESYSNDGVTVTSTKQLSLVDAAGAYSGVLSDTSKWNVLARGIVPNYGMNGTENDSSVYDYNFGYPVHSFNQLKLNSKSNALIPNNVFAMKTGNGTSSKPILINNAGKLDAIRTTMDIALYYKVIYDIVLPSFDAFGSNGIANRWIGIGDIVESGNHRYSSGDTIKEFKGYIYSDNRFLGTNIKEIYEGGRDVTKNPAALKSLSGFKNSGLLGTVNNESEIAAVSYVRFGNFTGLNSLYAVTESTSNSYNGAAVNFLKNGTVSDCEITKTITTAENSGAIAEYLGGLVGFVYSGANAIIQNNVMSGANIEGRGVAGATNFVGGFVGASVGNLIMSKNKMATQTANTISVGRATDILGGLIAQITDEGENAISISENEISQIELGKEDKAVAIAGGLVGNIYIENENTKLDMRVCDNIITPTAMYAKIIGGVVGIAQNVTIYGNTVGEENIINIGACAVFGGVVGVALENSEIGTTRQVENKQYNVVNAEFEILSVSSTKAVVNQKELRGYGLVAGVMLDNCIMSSVRLGTENYVCVLKISDNLLIRSDALNIVQNIENMGGLVGLMSGGNLGSLDFIDPNRDTINNPDYFKIKGFRNVGGLIGMIDPSLSVQSGVYMPAFVKGSDSIRFGQIYGLQNVGGIIGKYAGSETQANSLTDIVNKNNVFVYNSDIKINNVLQDDIYEKAHNSTEAKYAITNFGGIVGYMSKAQAIINCANFGIIGADFKEAENTNSYQASYADYVGGITSKIGEIAEFIINDSTGGQKVSGEAGNYYISADASKIQSKIVTTANKKTDDNSAIYGNKYVGGIIGYMQGEFVGALSGKISNDMKIYGNDSVGGIAGLLYGEVKSLETEITQYPVENHGLVSGVLFKANADEQQFVHELNSTSNLIDLNNKNVGGLFGVVAGTPDVNSTSDAPLDGQIAGGRNYASVYGLTNVGGGIGLIDDRFGPKTVLNNIETIKANSDTKVVGLYNAGGIVGNINIFTSNDNAAAISTATNNTNVAYLNVRYDNAPIMSDNIGGIAGRIVSKAPAGESPLQYISLQNAVNNAEIEGVSNVGGLVGYAQYTSFGGTTTSNMGVVKEAVETADWVYTVNDRNIIQYYKLFTKDLEYGIESFEKDQTLDTDEKLAQISKNGIGGIVGFGLYCSFNSVINKANVTANNMSNVGGAIGFYKGGLSAVSNNLPKVEGTSENVLQIKGNNNVGGMAGYIMQLASTQSAEFVSGNNVSALSQKTFNPENKDYVNVTGNYSVGGIIGYSDEIPAKNIMYSGSLDGNNNSAKYLGGLIGTLKDSGLYGNNNTSLNNIPDGKNFGGLIGMLKLSKGGPRGGGSADYKTVSVSGSHNYQYTVDTVENENYKQSITTYDSVFNLEKERPFLYYYDNNMSLNLYTSYQNKDKINISPSNNAVSDDAQGLSIMRVMQRYIPNRSGQLVDKIVDGQQVSQYNKGKAIEVYNAQYPPSEFTNPEEKIKSNPLLKEYTFQDKANEFLKYTNIHSYDLSWLKWGGSIALAGALAMIIWVPGINVIAVGITGIIGGLAALVTDIIDVDVKVTGYYANTATFDATFVGNTAYYRAQENVQYVKEYNLITLFNEKVHASQTIKEGYYIIESDGVYLYCSNPSAPGIASVEKINKYDKTWLKIADNFGDWAQNNDSVIVASQEYFKGILNERNITSNTPLYMYYLNGLYIAHSEDGIASTTTKLFNYHWQKVQTVAKLISEDYRNPQITTNDDGSNSYWSYYSDDINPQTDDTYSYMEEGVHYIKADRTYNYFGTYSDETALNNALSGAGAGIYGAYHIKSYFNLQEGYRLLETTVGQQATLSYFATYTLEELQQKFPTKIDAEGKPNENAVEGIDYIAEGENYYWAADYSLTGTEHLNYELSDFETYTIENEEGKTYRKGKIYKIGDKAYQETAPENFNGIINAYTTEAIGVSRTAHSMYWTINGLNPANYINELPEGTFAEQTIYAFWSQRLRNYRYFADDESCKTLYLDEYGAEMETNYIVAKKVLHVEAGLVNDEVAYRYTPSGHIYKFETLGFNVVYKEGEEENAIKAWEDNSIVVRTSGFEFRTTFVYDTTTSEQPMNLCWGGKSIDLISLIQNIRQNRAYLVVTEHLFVSGGSYDANGVYQQNISVLK